MDKAFDAILQSEVDATVIAKKIYYAGSDRFRYQCLCCGEEVYLAAVDSREMSPHFRHKRGNNDKECERYLGQPGAVERYISVRKSEQEHIEFYFNKERMTFEVSISFSEEELRDYEQNKSHMTVNTKLYGEPLLDVPINRSNFVSETKSYFTLTEYSYDYYVKLDGNKKVYAYKEIIKKYGGLNIFKVRIQDERAKHLGSNLLYTGITYIAISENNDCIHELSTLSRSISINDEFSFHTVGIDFYGATFSIKNVDYALKMLFQKHEYQIEISEAFDILWPPVHRVDSDYICTNEKIYVSSTFSLVPHGNTNINEQAINSIDDNISEISVDDQIIVYEKNIDVTVKRITENRPLAVFEEPTITRTEIYIVPDTYEFFLFDAEGCTRLITGMKVYLSGTNRVIAYKNGHIKEIIIASEKEKKKPEEVIADILKYHPQSEIYLKDEFADIILSDTAESYLEKCYRNGRINTVVKRYIKEGLI